MHARLADPAHQLGVVDPGKGLFQLFLGTQRGAQLTDVPALHQGQAVLHHLAADPGLEQLVDRHPGLQAVLTAMQRLPGAVQAPVQAQPQTAVQQSVAFQAIDQTDRRGAGRHVQQSGLIELQRLLQRHALLPEGVTQYKDNQQQAADEQPQQCTYHVQQSRRVRAMPCSLRVSGPGSHTRVSRRRTGQTP